MEFILSIIEDSLSKDLAHINSFGSISNNNNNILIIGNSLTREGIDQQLFESNINYKMIFKGNIGYIYPDDSSIIEWYHIFYWYFAQSQIYPDQLFVIFAQDQLATGKIEFEEIQRISKYVPFNFLLNVIADEKLSLSQSIEIYLSKLFRIYSNRERIKKRILNIIPNFRNTIRRLNQNLKSIKKLKTNKKDYYHLNKLIQLTDSLSIHTTFCAIPLPKLYNIDSELIKIINSSQYCKLINLQNTIDFTKNEFIDGYHLNQDGARKFTNTLTEIIPSIQ